MVPDAVLTGRLMGAITARAAPSRMVSVRSLISDPVLTDTESDAAIPGLAQSLSTTSGRNKRLLQSFRRLLTLSKNEQPWLRAALFLQLCANDQKMFYFGNYFWHHPLKGDRMENFSYFYLSVTKIAEDRIKELVQSAREAEAGSHVFPEAGSYLRACAQTVYFAWLDVTSGWHTKD